MCLEVEWVLMHSSCRSQNFKSKSAQSVFPSVKQANASVKTNRWKEEVLERWHEIKRKMKINHFGRKGTLADWLVIWLCSRVIGWYRPPSGWLVCLELGQQLWWRGCFNQPHHHHRHCAIRNQISCLTCGEEASSSFCVLATTNRSPIDINGQRFLIDIKTAKRSIFSPVGLS